LFDHLVANLGRTGTTVAAHRPFPHPIRHAATSKVLVEAISVLLGSGRQERPFVLVHGTGESLMSAAPTMPESDASVRPGSGPENCASGLRPVVRIGVTGHRDLADPAAARDLAFEGMRVVLRTLDAAVRPRRILRLARPPAVPVGYQIISPLAEGADRVVADSIFSDDPDLSGRSRELVVPLPFPLDVYRGSDSQPGTDCSDAASRAEFSRLQGAAIWTRQVPPPPPSRSGSRSDADDREARYREVGSFVVAHSDVLLALWDGLDNESASGTAAIVAVALGRGVPVIWVPVTRGDQQESGAPGALKTECQLLLDTEHRPGQPDRDDRGETLRRAAESSLSLGSTKAAKVLSGHRRGQLPLQSLVLERLRRTQELEWRAGSQPRTPVVAACNEPAGDVSSPEAADGDADYTKQLVADAARWIEAPYARADSLARKYQHRLRYVTIGVYAAAATAVTLGAFAAILFPYGGNWRLPVVFEALVLIALLTVQSLEVRATLRDRWVAYRAMTEFMRVGRYLALVPPKLSTATDFHRMAQPRSWSSEPSLTPWFAPVLERLWDRRPDVDLGRVDVRVVRDYLVRHWVNDQIAYHERRSDTHHHWDRSFAWAIRVILIATVLAVLLHAVRGYAPAFLGRRPGRDLIAALLAFLTIVLTSVAAAFNGYSGQQRHGFHYARFRRMVTELTDIRDGLKQADTIEGLRRSIGEVSRVTLGEATDWFQDMRNQLLDSPA
jgi:ABC-type glycerol-3-phosphate transport system permease component